MTGTLTLRSDEPLAVEFTAALKQGEVDRLRRLLAANRGLAHCVVENLKSSAGDAASTWTRAARWFWSIGPAAERNGAG